MSEDSKVPATKPATAATKAQADQYPVTFETQMQCGWAAAVKLISPEVGALIYDWPILETGVDLHREFRFLVKDAGAIEEMLVENIERHEVDDGALVIHSNKVRMNAKCEDRRSNHVFGAEGVEKMMQMAKQGGEAFWTAWYKGDFTIPAKINQNESEINSEPLVRKEQAAYTVSSVFDGFCGDVVAELANRVWNCALIYAMKQSGSQGGVEAGDIRIQGVEALAAVITSAILTRTGTWKKLDHPFLPPGTDYQLDPGAIYNMNCGSTMATVVLDHVGGKLYALNLGDCRVVAGWWRPNEAVWECDTLTQDYTPENPGEAGLLREGHPEIPPEKMVYMGRVVGNEMFGSISHSRNLGGGLHVHGADVLGPACGTIGNKIPDHHAERGATNPPYTITTPGLAIRETKQTDRELKFVILATDGLWDRITSEEAVILTAAHLAHPTHGDIPKTELSAAFPLLHQSDEERLYPAKPYPGSEGYEKGMWKFQDEDPVTHLFRNAQGDGNDLLRRMGFSMPPECRAMRDDMTCNILLF